MDLQNQHLDDLHEIRKIMQRSSRFLSLSGLSGIAAGVWALAGAWLAFRRTNEYLIQEEQGPRHSAFQDLKNYLFFLAIAVLVLALLTAFYFTWRRAGKNKTPLWDHTARLLTLNMMIPLVAGGIFILTLLQYHEWRFVAPACLIFYGLALVNGSKYTLSDIRYLGIIEIVLGLVNTQYMGFGLIFWAVGFGVLHIIYGFLMWWKNERKPDRMSAS
ncbi:MAG: hypothetical protein ACJ75B_16005 [Flavisolibacter sp.]